MTYNISINIKVTDGDVMDIMCSAIEGGIGYWACLDNTTKEFEDAPKDEPYSETCAKILLNGGGIWLMDDDGEYWLSLLRDYSMALSSGLKVAVINTELYVLMEL